MTAAIHIDLDEEAVAPQGYVVVSVRGTEPASPGARFTLRRFGFGNDHLGPTGWVPGETPLTPDRVVHTADGAKLFIAPEICRFLSPDQLVEFGFLGDGVTCTGKAKLLWPEVAAPAPAAAMPEADDDIDLGDDPAPQATVAAKPALTADRRGQARAATGTPWAKIAVLSLAVLVLVGGLGGAGWYFLAGPGSTMGGTPQTAAAGPASGATDSAKSGKAAPSTSGTATATAASPAGNTREQVAAFIKGQPPSVAAFGEAERLAHAGVIDGAFLLYRYAADKGHTPSMIAIGKMYDPTIADPAAQKFVRPSAETAASWYKRAASESEGQLLLGKLMLKGGADLPADKAAAREWLQKAAAAGNGDAKQLLSSLD